MVKVSNNTSSIRLHYRPQTIEKHGRSIDERGAYNMDLGAKQNPWLAGQGAKSPEARGLLNFACPMEVANLSYFLSVRKLSKMQFYRISFDKTTNSRLHLGNQ